MSLKLRWTNPSELDVVAHVRMLAYAAGRDQLPRFVRDIHDDPRTGSSAHVIAERDGEPVGVATSLPLTMWVRGGAVPCQGVASVGTARTARRRTGSGPGVGSAVMQEVLRHARQRGDVVSALMPFRVSFYENFGYGVVEQKKEWIIPLDLIPRGEFDAIRYYRDEDFDELVKCRQRIAQANQCDIERSAELWKWYISDTQGFFLVDRAGDGPVRGWMTIEQPPTSADGIDTLRARWDFGYQDIASLRRFIYFLGSLRDQYRFALVHLPTDFPLNLLLKEKQLTHRINKNHPNATERQYTRMQVRVLDHKRFLEAMKLANDAARGKAVVAVSEEAGPAKFELDVAEGRIAVKPTTAEPDVECSARDWATIACGEVRASLAADLGMLNVNRGAVISILDVLGEGPRPYCREYF